MEFLRKIKGTIYAIFSWIIYAISFFFPRDKKLWIVMGWRRKKERELFGDNAKYFFLYASNNLDKDIKVVWIGRDERICQILRKRGYIAHSINSIKGIMYSLKAGYTIVDANLRLENWKYSGGSRLVQLWHGKSLKKMGHDSPYAMGKYKRFSSPNLFRKFYLLAAASKFLGKFNVSGFRMKEEDLVVSGLPRYDVMFDDIKDSDIDVDYRLKYKIDYLKTKYKKIVFYGPTFRPDGSNPLEEADLRILNQTLFDKDYYCFISLHPKFATKDWQPKEKFTNISFIDVLYDIYPIMNKFDLLITDYSSLALDFLLVNVPSILYIYDLDSFKKGMGIHQEIAEAMPGPRVESFDKLLEVLGGDSYIWNDKHREARDKFFTFQDGNSSKRIFDLLVKMVDIPGKTISEAKKYLES